MSNDYYKQLEHQTRVMFVITNEGSKKDLTRHINSVVKRFADVEDISFGFVAQDKFLPAIESYLPGVSFENFDGEKGDMHIIINSKNNGVQQFDMNDEKYLHMDAIIGKAAMKKTIEPLDDANLRIVDAINQPLVLLTHKGDSLQDLESYNSVMNSNLVYASESRDTQLYKNMEKQLGSKLKRNEKNKVKAYIITQELLIYELDNEATAENLKNFTDDFLQNKISAKNNEKKADLSSSSNTLDAIKEFNPDLQVHDQLVQEGIETEFDLVLYIWSSLKNEALMTK